jgi:RNA polymerase sigma-70 factor (ECF subfamily)
MLAYEELVHRHRDKLYARAYSMMRNEEEASDMAQEAFIKGWQRLEQFHGQASFSTWMTRITINLCLDLIRKKKRQRAESVERLEEDLGGVERQMDFGLDMPVPWAGLERTELRKRIEKALGKLTEAHRTVIVLHEFERLEYKEIAKRLRISIGTVMSRLFYARRRMASLLAGLKREREE